MANSLRAKLSKLRHDGHITTIEYQEFLKKMDGHDRELREDVYAEAIADLKQRFRNEYEEMMELEMEDCINWADWLDATAEQILADRKG